jgi:FeS assembly protein IscX
MHWTDIEEIAEALEENYSDEEIPERNLPYLKEMVLSLSNFEDHEVEVDDDLLNQIIEHWLELRE